MSTTRVTQQLQKNPPQKTVTLHLQGNESKQEVVTVHGDMTLVATAELDEILHNMQELKKLAMEVNELLTQQDPMIEHAVSNIQNTEANMNDAREELIEAKAYQRRCTIV